MSIVNFNDESIVQLSNIPGIEELIGELQEVPSDYSLLRRILELQALLSKLNAKISSVTNEESITETLSDQLTSILNAVTSGNSVYSEGTVTAISVGSQSAVTIVVNVLTDLDFRKVKIYNSGTNRALLRYGSADATTTIYTNPLPSGFAVEDETFRGRISAICPSGSTTLLLTEFY